jgi:N,N'-diacetyllegionaminate synthase
MISLRQEASLKGIWMDKVFIIAEAGVNHNGSMDLAKKLIDVAIESGADAIKFQTFKADKLLIKNTKKAEYQKKSSAAGESQYEMIKKLELDEASHRILVSYCEKKKITFLSTQFDHERI